MQTASASRSLLSKAPTYSGLEVLFVSDALIVKAVPSAMPWAILTFSAVADKQDLAASDFVRRCHQFFTKEKITL
jgi:hypothetical protein